MGVLHIWPVQPTSQTQSPEGAQAPCAQYSLHKETLHEGPDQICELQMQWSVLSQVP